MNIVMQEGNNDCGVACLLSIIRYYGGDISIDILREDTNTDKSGVSALNLINCAKKYGFDSYGVNGLLIDIDTNLFPVIAHIKNNNYNHFVVVYRISPENDKVYIMDPAIGKRAISFSEFYYLSTNNFIILKPIKKIINYSYQKILLDIIYKFIIDYKIVFIIIFILSLIYFVIGIYSSFHLKYLVNYSINYNLTTNIFIISIIILFIYLFKNIFYFLRNQILNKYLLLLDLKLSTYTYNRIIHLPYLYFKNRNSGEIINRFKDLIIVRDYVINFLLYFFIDLLSVIVFIIFMFNISYKISLFVVIYILLYLIIYYIFKKYEEKILKNIKNLEDNINHKLVNSITNILSIKNIHIEKRFSDEFYIDYDKYINKNYDLFKFNNMYLLIKENINKILLVIIYGIGTYLVIDKKISFLDLFLYEIFFNYFMDSFNRELDIIKKYSIFKISMRRIDDLFSISSEKFFSSFYYLNYSNIDNISINNLFYKINNKIIFNNINLDINSKDKILLIGKSGVGKSSLVKILMRYILIDYGMVSINDIDINHYHLDIIRNNIIYVSEKEMLFDGSLYNNICLGKDIDSKIFDKVTKLLKIDDICNGNYDMRIEDGGFNLSSGERQRVIICRSLIKDRSIYIFDESFNGIDIKLEKLLLKRLLKYLNNKIVIVISHRLDNVGLFDRVIELKDGDLIER